MQLSHTHIYAYSIILQLTVCRNVNTHPQEPLRFTTPRLPSSAPPYYMRLAFLPLDERRGVTTAAVPAAVFAFQFVYSFIPVPYSLRHHLSLDWLCNKALHSILANESVNEVHIARSLDTLYLVHRDVCPTLYTPEAVFLKRHLLSTASSWHCISSWTFLINYT